jgi:phytoene dehydrogenase-like protein
MSERYDVVVIGAGLGGVVCAALLAKEGLNVLILDKNSRPGGKQMGFESKGFKHEMWPTYGIPMERGPFVEAFKALGIESKLDVIPKTSALLYRRPDGKWITAIRALWMTSSKFFMPTAAHFDSAPGWRRSSSRMAGLPV